MEVNTIVKPISPAEGENIIGVVIRSEFPDAADHSEVRWISSERGVFEELEMDADLIVVNAATGNVKLDNYRAAQVERGVAMNGFYEVKGGQ